MIKSCIAYSPPIGFTRFPHHRCHLSSYPDRVLSGQFPCHSRNWTMLSKTGNGASIITALSDGQQNTVVQSQPLSLSYVSSLLPSSSSSLSILFVLTILIIVKSPTKEIPAESQKVYLVLHCLPRRKPLLLNLKLLLSSPHKIQAIGIVAFANGELQFRVGHCVAEREGRWIENSKVNRRS